MRLLPRWFLSLFVIASGCTVTPSEDVLLVDIIQSKSGLIDSGRGEVIMESAGDQNRTTFNRYRLDIMSQLMKNPRLQPTHKALRVIPANIEQLHSLEKDSSLVIYYHPFDYEPEQESMNIDKNDLCENVTLPTNDCCLEFEECSEQRRVLLPVYVFWPRYRVIPDTINYSFLYDAFIPDESIGLSKGPLTTVTGRLMAYDNRLGSNAPISNVTLRYRQFWILDKYTYTDSDGYFTLSNTSANSPLTIVLQNNKFVIRDSLTTDRKELNLNNLSDYISSDNYAEVFLPANFYLDVYKAAWYYFYGANDLLNDVTRYDSTTNVIDIHAINDRDTFANYLGGFYYAAPPYICIWNPYKLSYALLQASSLIFGTVNHELGHATNYVTVGQEEMASTESVIKESFASFFGWFNVKDYYSSIIASHSDVHSICTQGRQSWTSGNYTPFYIDLYDNYNQYDSLLPLHRFNNDPISNVPLSIILDYALGPKAFYYVYLSMLSYIGTYYSGVDYMTFTAPYSSFMPSVSMMDYDYIHEF